MSGLGTSGVRWGVGVGVCVVCWSVRALVRMILCGYLCWFQARHCIYNSINESMLFESSDEKVPSAIEDLYNVMCRTARATDESFYRLSSNIDIFAHRSLAQDQLAQAENVANLEEVARLRETLKVKVKLESYYKAEILRLRIIERSREVLLTENAEISRQYRQMSIYAGDYIQAEVNKRCDKFHGEFENGMTLASLLAEVAELTATNLHLRRTWAASTPKAIDDVLKKSEISSQLTEIDALKESIVALKHELAASVREVALLKTPAAEAISLRAEVDALKVSGAALNHELSASYREVALLKTPAAEVISLRAEVDVLKVSSVVLKSAKDEAAAEVSSLRVEVDALKVSSVALNYELAASHREVALLKTPAAEAISLRAEVDALKVSGVALKSAKDKAAAEVSSLQAEVDVLKLSSVALKRAKDEAAAEVSSQRAEVDALKVSSVALERAKDKAAAEVSSLRADLKRAHVSLTSSEGTISQQKTEIAILEDSAKQQALLVIEQRLAISALTSALDSSDDEDDPGSVTEAVGAAAAAVQNVAAQAAVAAAAVRTTRTKPQTVYLQASPNGSGDESEPGAAGQDAALGAGALGDALGPDDDSAHANGKRSAPARSRKAISAEIKERELTSDGGAGISSSSKSLDDLYAELESLGPMKRRKTEVEKLTSSRNQPPVRCAFCVMWRVFGTVSEKLSCYYYLVLGKSLRNHDPTSKWSSRCRCPRCRCRRCRCC